MELCDSAHDFVLKRGLERGPKRGQVMVAHHLPQAWLDIHRDFRFVCSRWAPSTPESRSAHETLLHRTLVQGLRPPRRSR